MRTTFVFNKDKSICDGFDKWIYQLLLELKWGSGEVKRLSARFWLIQVKWSISNHSDHTLLRNGW